MLPIVGSTQFLFSPQGKNELEIDFRNYSHFLEYFAVFAEKTLEAAIELCKQFNDGFAYWTFGIFTYVIYSADLFEVIEPRNFTFKCCDV